MGLEEEKDRISQTTKSKQSNLEEACWPELEIFRLPSNATNFKSKVSSLKYRVRLILGCNLYQIWYIICTVKRPLREAIELLTATKLLAPNLLFYRTNVFLTSEKRSSLNSDQRPSTVTPDELNLHKNPL